MTVPTGLPAGPRMRFSIDTWDPAYGSSLQFDEDLDDSSARIDTDVEVPAAAWAPVAVPRGVEPPSRVLFVDGVRRIDARAWVDTGVPGHGGAPVDGGTDAGLALCASYAAGVVCCCPGQAHLVSARTQRGLFTTAEGADDVVTGAGTWTARTVDARRVRPVGAALSAALQNQLAELEVAVAVDARGTTDHPPVGDDLLVVDGPLRGRTHLPRTLGMIKTHRTAYLTGRQQAVVVRLAPGERTPVFQMGTSWERRTWYLRLPGPVASPWAGVVRVECSADAPVDEAVRLAGLSQAVLGRYASTAYKDPRAPQNLYPISGLERELRRRLGDARVLERLLRRAAAAG